MTDTEAWVEVRLWTKERGQRGIVRFRGKLRQLEIQREVVVMNYNTLNNYLQPGGEGSLRWIEEGWKMDHGSPAGFYPPVRLLEDSDGDQ